MSSAITRLPSILTSMVFVSLGALLGCAPANARGLATDRVGVVADANRELINAGKRPLDGDQIAALLGSPDEAVSPSRLRVLFTEATGFTAERASKSMSRIYGEYCRSVGHGSRRTPTANEGWQQDQTFLQCQIWLYDWINPHEICLGGPPPQATGLVSSSYFLLHNGQAVSQGYLLRREAKKR